MPYVLIATVILLFFSPMTNGPLFLKPTYGTESPATTISRVLRGETVCTDNSQGETKNCGADNWVMYVHTDGSRTMHVASETSRNGEVRHALIVVDASGKLRESFMHNRSRNGAIGSTFVTLTENRASAASNDVGSGSLAPGIELSEIETTEPANSLSAGPASADGLHFLQYDFEKAGEQARNIYWMGGSRQGTMVGSFRTTTHTYIGETKITMPSGEDAIVDLFRMSSGTEVWLTKEDRVVVRMDVKFGNISGSRFDLTDFEVTETTP